MYKIKMKGLQGLKGPAFFRRKLKVAAIVVFKCELDGGGGTRKFF